MATARELVREVVTPAGWGAVQRARDPRRPRLGEFLPYLLDDFLPLRGDRQASDDPALLAGVGLMEQRRVVVVGTEKGRGLASSRSRWGMPSAAGYRKAARAAILASRLRLPLISLVDTPGAFPGRQAEEEGQAWAIAQCIMAFLSAPTPTLALVFGEGGSGGAMALTATDLLIMLEGATFSVISPEGCSSILWRDPTLAERAAEALLPGAPACQALGVCHRLLPDPPLEAEAFGRHLGRAILEGLDELSSLPEEVRLARRREVWRRAGDAAQMLLPEGGMQAGAGGWRGEVPSGPVGGSSHLARDLPQR